MKHNHPDSSLAYASEYDKDTQEMTVHFRTGTSSIYSGVPESVYKAAVEAPSFGAYFHAHIKRGYPSRRAEAKQ